MLFQTMRLISFITFNITSIDRKGGILLGRKGTKDAKESWIKMGSIATNYGPFKQTITPKGRDLGLVAALWFYCIGFLNLEVLFEVQI